VLSDDGKLDMERCQPFRLLSYPLALQRDRAPRLHAPQLLVAFVASLLMGRTAVAHRRHDPPTMSGRLSVDVDAVRNIRSATFIDSDFATATLALRCTLVVRSTRPILTCWLTAA
jgi:hypothetical protein